MKREVSALEEKYAIKALRVDCPDIVTLSCCKEENRFREEKPEDNYEDIYSVAIMTLENYNLMENRTVKLGEKQVLFYSSGENCGYDRIEFLGEQVEVAEELPELYPWPKSGTSDFGASYVIVVSDEAEREKYIKNFASVSKIEDYDDLTAKGRQIVGVFLEGEDELKQDFIRELSGFLQSREGIVTCSDGLRSRSESKTMYGGLLFVGIIFGIVFFMCLLLVMYYKQVSEGYEDQGSFAIMQKVGMSDKEIKSTIHRHLFMVFFLPLFGALMHTFAGSFMVKALMGALSLFNSQLIAKCCVGVSLLFILIYGVSYVITAKVYYRIVS